MIEGKTSLEVAFEQKLRKEKAMQKSGSVCFQAERIEDPEIESSFSCLMKTGISSVVT